MAKEVEQAKQVYEAMVIVVTPWGRATQHGTGMLDSSSTGSGARDGAEKIPAKNI